jgi:hypothetical protein
MESSLNTTEKILAAIETKHVKPRPTWYFVIRNILLWIPGLITTFLGAYAVSGVLYGVLHAHLFENSLYTANTNRLESLVAIPLLWIVSFGIFSLITIAFLRRTNKGYRHPATQLLSLSLAISVIIGILFYAITSGSLAGPGSLYRYPTQHQQQAIWNDPQNGRISGVITDVDSTSLNLVDFHGAGWTVDIKNIPADESSLLRRGNAIRIVGIATDVGAFNACRILQWELFPNETAPLQLQQAFTRPKTLPSCDTIIAHPAQ